MTVEFTVRWEGMDQLERRFQHLTPQMRENARLAIKETGISLVSTQKQLAQSMKAVDRGGLIHSIHDVYTDGGLTVLAGPSVKYAPYVTGTGGIWARMPGSKMPPWRKGTSLYRWVQLHGMVTKSRPRAVYVHGRNMTGEYAQSAYENQLASTSYMIARSIARRGIRAKPFVEESLVMEAPAYIQRIYKAVGLTLEGR